LPLAAWACLIGALWVTNWIWEGRSVQYGQFGFAVAVIVLAALVLVLLNREAIKRGAPPRAGVERPQRIPDVSFGAVGVAIAIGSVVFGLTFGHFLVYFGCGLFVLSAARLAVELRAARRQRRGIELPARGGEGGGPRNGR
jgi:Na+/H+-translocating membrane pyrophosphatase